MKLGTAVWKGRPHAFTQTAEEVLYYDAVDVGELVSTPSWAQDVRHEAGDPPLPEHLRLPISRPAKIICVGLNYHAHALEVGKSPPEIPTLFSKVATSLVGPNDAIILPRLSSKVDWEAELAIVIGSTTRNARRDTVSESVLGYSALNDVSARDWQQRTSEWFQGKNFDKTAPFGPFIVTADEADPASGLAITCTIDGELMQSGNTLDMIFDPLDLVTYISKILTLEPGDIIATGTPSGVGAGRKPAKFLKPGQVVTTEIAGIGTLVNKCVAEDVVGHP